MQDLNAFSFEMWILSVFKSKLGDFNEITDSVGCTECFSEAQHCVHLDTCSSWSCVFRASWFTVNAVNFIFACIESIMCIWECLLGLCYLHICIMSKMWTDIYCIFPAFWQNKSLSIRNVKHSRVWTLESKKIECINNSIAI